MTGPFVTQGTKLEVSSIKIKTLPDGSIAPVLELKIGYDVCPNWAKIAVDHVITAQRCRADRDNAWRENDDETKGLTLVAEFEASMQAITAAAFSVDALFGCIKPHVKLDEETKKKWRNDRTPRYVQVSECLRRAFRLSGDDNTNLRKGLKGLYKLRDLAVHSTAETNNPVQHHELDALVEWRFNAYRAQIAEVYVGSLVNLLKQISEDELSTNPAINNYTRGLKAKITPISLRLEQKVQ